MYYPSSCMSMHEASRFHRRYHTIVVRRYVAPAHYLTKRTNHAMVHDSLSTTLLRKKYGLWNQNVAFAVSPQCNVFASRLCRMRECCVKSSSSSSLNAMFEDSTDKVQTSRIDTTSDPSRLFELLSPIESVQPDQMSASTLAYLGDVVFELFIRSRYVWPERRMSDLQNKVVSIVRGE